MVAARLLLAAAPAPVSRALARQLPEGGRECSLRGIPSVAAIKAIESPLSHSIFMACSSRCWRSQACGESPVLSLNARQKWKRDRPASDASAASETSVSTLERRRWIARFNVIGDKPPMADWGGAGAPAWPASRRVASRSVICCLTRVSRAALPSSASAALRSRRDVMGSRCADRSRCSPVYEVWVASPCTRDCA